MTKEQKRLLKAMKTAYFTAALTIFLFFAFAAAFVAFTMGEKNIMMPIVVGSLGLMFTIFSSVQSAKTYKKSADIIKNGETVICTVEFMFTVKRGKEYVYTPMMKTPEGDFLITLGEYDRSMYITIPVKSLADRELLQIQRKNRSEVKEGDTVIVYIKDYPDFRLDPNQLEKSAENYEQKLEAMKKVKVFEGVVDVERIEK